MVSRQSMSVFEPDFITANLANFFYHQLTGNIDWDDGTCSGRNHVAPKTYMVEPGHVPDLDLMVLSGAQKMASREYLLNGICLNWYQEEGEYVPIRPRKGFHQFVISLGSPQVMSVGKKDYPLTDGSALLFDGSARGHSAGSYKSKGYISITGFLTPL